MEILICIVGMWIITLSLRCSTIEDKINKVLDELRKK